MPLRLVCHVEPPDALLEAFDKEVMGMMQEVVFCSISLSVVCLSVVKVFLRFSLLSPADCFSTLSWH